MRLAVKRVWIWGLFALPLFLAWLYRGQLPLQAFGAAQTATAKANPSNSRANGTVMFNTPAADKVLARMRIFPSNNPWNEDISKWPLHPNSGKIIASIGNDKPMRYNPDMAFILVPSNQKRIHVSTEYVDESDPGPYPIPENLPIEGWPVASGSQSLDDYQRDRANMGGDRHAIVVVPAAGKLYEFLNMRKTDNGWKSAQASIFDLRSNKLRPDGWTSADAAGLPIFPAIVRHDDIERGIVRHAMRVTVRRTRRAYVYPATHYASRLEGMDLPRMGERVRLKKGFDTSRFSKTAKAILEGLKRHGMFVADNGIEWAISVAPDERLPLDDLNGELRKVRGSDFEIVRRPGDSSR